MDDDEIARLIKTTLEKQENLAKSANTRKGQKAQDKPSKSILEQQNEHASRDPYPSSQGHYLRQTCIGYAYPPCVLPLKDLEPIEIHELRLETVHRGRVLFVRTFGHPNQIHAVQNVVEDGAQDVDRIAVYNLDLRTKKEDVLPRGQIFAIKEPFYKATADGGYTIRVDHPSDLVHLDVDHEMVPLGLLPKLMELKSETAAHWKDEGNEAFKKKRHAIAIDCYTKGIEACKIGEPDIVMTCDLLRNRAIANLHLHRYETALKDAEAAILPDEASTTEEERLSRNSKAYYRAGRAAYCLAEYAKAAMLYGKSDTCCPGDQDTIRELKRNSERLREQTAGIYNFDELTKAFIIQPTRFDVADFKKLVEIRETSSRGNGLFAKQTFKAGDLILCEKAFSVVFGTEQGNSTSIAVNLNTKTGTMGAHSQLNAQVIQKMLHNPSQAQQVLKLYDGDYKPKCGKVVDGIVAVDTFQLAAIAAFNGFGCHSKPLTHTQEDSTKSDSSTGLWIMASNMNHDCIGNSCRGFIGDVMIVRASKDIKKGEEITQAYVYPTFDNVEFQGKLQRAWKFRCDCVLCKAESKTTAIQRQRRIALNEDVRKFLDANPIGSPTRPPTDLAIGEAETLYQKLQDTYDKSVFQDLPRIALQELGLWLTSAVVYRGRSSKSRNYGLATLRDFGYMITVKKGKLTVHHPHGRSHVLCLDAAMYTAMAYRLEGQRKVEEQMVEFAKTLYTVCYGSLAGFAARFPSE